jgi:hypothetical protein
MRAENRLQSARDGDGKRPRQFRTLVRAMSASPQASGIALFIAWFWIGVRENNYVRFSRTPQPEIGRTVAQEVKGVTVYISQQDHQFDVRLERVCLGCGIMLAICFVLSGELSKIINPGKPLPPLS